MMFLDSLIYLVIALSSGVIGAITSSMLSFAMQDGMLLDRYHAFLMKLPTNLSKPMGLCPYCFAPYVSILLVILFIALFSNIVVFSILGFLASVFYVYVAIMSSYVTLAWNQNKLISQFQDGATNFKNFYDEFFKGWTVGNYPEADKIYMSGLTYDFTDEEYAQLIKAFKSFIMNEEAIVTDYTDKPVVHNNYTNKPVVHDNYTEILNAVPKVSYSSIVGNPTKCTTCGKNNKTG